MTRSPRKLKVVSLFTGAGGLDVGFESTGRYELLAAVEFEQSFCDTLVLNRDAGRFGSERTQVLRADISKLDPAELMDLLRIQPGEIDVLIGGPPCQSWSTAGRRGTAQDARGQLIWDFLRFVEAMKPSVFLMENVRGLLSAALVHRPIAERPNRGGALLAPEEQPGSAVAAWVDDALKIDSGAYRVDSFEVNAVNYGAPQLRERVLFFGNRLGVRVSFPAPTHGPSSGAGLPFGTLADALAGLEDPSPVMMDFSPRKKRYLDLIPEGGNWRALSPELAQESMGRAYFAKGGRSGWWRRLSWDLPSPTITTLPSHSSTSLCHPTETRVLSVRESAAVQEFPRDWEFSGTAQEQMKQVGNAVPVRLGQISAELIADLIDAPMEVPSRMSGARYTNTYLTSHVRTRSWWKDGRAVIRGQQATEQKAS